MDYRGFLERKRTHVPHSGFDPGDGVSDALFPLQFDIVDRLIERYSNPGELVYDPFGGLGTVPLRAMKMGRKGRGVELNTGYFLDAVKYLEAEERRQSMPTLFDMEGIGE